MQVASCLANSIVDSDYDHPEQTPFSAVHWSRIWKIRKRYWFLLFTKFRYPTFRRYMRFEMRLMRVRQV